MMQHNKKRIFVTATNTDIGKTYTTALLLEEFASRGLRVGVLKPIETGVKGVAPDGERLLSILQKLNSESHSLHLSDIVPITYELAAAPWIASNATPLDFQKIECAIERVEALCDILIIEGAGGLYVPIDDRTMMIDLISYLDASALLVTHCSLGCINDTILSENALKERGIDYVRAFNCREDDIDFSTVSQPYFLKDGGSVLKVSSEIDTICDLLYNL